MHGKYRFCVLETITECVIVDLQRLYRNETGRASCTADSDKGTVSYRFTGNYQ